MRRAQFSASALGSAPQKHATLMKQKEGVEKGMRGALTLRPCAPTPPLRSGCRRPLAMLALYSAPIAGGGDCFLLRFFAAAAMRSIARRRKKPH
jgi:hypothetical protein